MRSVYESIAPEIKDIRLKAKSDGVEVFNVNCLDDCLSSLSSLPLDLALFTGGGMVSRSMISLFPRGIINVHMGGLPQFKGMDVPQAAVLEGCFDHVTMTSHLMSASLDAGPVISRFSVSSDSYQDIGAMRNELSAVSPFISVYSALALFSGRLEAVTQPISGDQYYILHHKLASLLAIVMSNRFNEFNISTPSSILSDFVARLDVRD